MATLCPVGRIRRKVEPFAGRCTGKAKSVKKRTTRNDRNGFLTHSFQPFWAYYGKQEITEREFFGSLSNICSYYDLLVPDVLGEAFPQNIYKAWHLTAERIQHIDNKMDCIILKDEQHTASIATVRQFNTDMTLYYIPVRPLWKWSQVAQAQPLAEIVTVLFVYLHQVVGIPWYTDRGSYLGGQYNYIEEMINEDEYNYANGDADGDENSVDEDKAYREMQLGELYTLQNAGHHLFDKMSDPQGLERIEELVLNYSKTENSDNDWAMLAIEFVQLYRQYPNRSFFDHIHPELYYPEIEERIDAEQYISFYWSGNDSLTDTVFEIINCDLQEKGVTDEPITIEVFDTLENKGTDNFGFETRLLALINRLVDLLNKNDYDHDERE